MRLSRSMVLAAVFGGLLPMVEAAADDPPKVGEQFPGLQFPVLGGEDLSSMAQFQGTKVLLIQFASW